MTLAKFVISYWDERNCGWVPDAASLCASKRCKSVCKTARLTKCTYYQLLPHSTFWIGLDSHRFGPDNWYTEMSSTVYTRYAVYCLQAIPIVRLLPKHRIKTDFVQSRNGTGRLLHLLIMPREKEVEKLLLLLLQSHNSLNRLCLWSVQTYPWQSLWFPTERSAIVAGYQMLPHFAQVKDARALARLQEFQSIPTTSYYHTVLFELDWTAIGLALTTGILRWVAKSIQDMLSTVYRLYPLSHFCQKIRLKLTSVQSRLGTGTGRLLHLLIMPREKEVEKLLLLLLQSHSSLNRLCLWSVQTYPWQRLWFPAERSAIVAGYQMLPHFAQVKDARALARLQEFQSIPTTSYYHTVLFELDWTAIGLALTTGILKWVAQSIQEMLSTVDRLYPFVRLLPKHRIKTDFVQSRNGTWRLLHLLIMPREKEVEKLFLLLLQSHSSLNRLCLWSVQTYPWQRLWFPAERSAIVAGYQMLPHFAQVKDARAFARLQDLQSIPTTSYYHTVLFELDWTAIGLALTTGILKWVAQSIQDMLSTVYRLYRLSDFCQNIGLKLTSRNQETAREGCCISWSCLVRKK